jgi:hypothetical protein
MGKDGKDNDEKGDGLRNGRVVIKSCPTKLTRITLRGTKSKPIEINRPPWNTGSPSPTTTKASSTQAKRTIRALATKLPNRQKVHSQGEPISSQSLKDCPQVAESKPEPAVCTPTPEPSNLITSSKDPKSGPEWGYKQLEEFLQLATGTAASPRPKETKTATPTTQPSTEVGLQEDPKNADIDAGTLAAPTEAINRAIRLPQLLRDQTEESFFESELMTSPRLKIPSSSPVLTTMQLSPPKPIQASMASSPRINEEYYLEEKLASERRRAYIPAVFAQAGDRVQLDQECNDKQAVFQRMIQPTPTVVKSQSPMSRGWPTSLLQFDPETSDEGHTLPQTARALPSMIKVPCLASRTLPIPHLQLDLESAGEGQTAPQRAMPPPAQGQLDQGSSTGEISANQQAVQQTQLMPWVQHYNPSTSTPTWAQIVRGDFPFHANEELSGEDYALKSRPIINRSRRLRQSRSQSSIKSVKWDPAIIACGPITAAREPPSQSNANALPEVSQAYSEKSKLEDNLEVFRMTISQWKKGDRKAIRKFLEALKNLDSDEEPITKPKQALKKEPKQPKSCSNIAPGKGLNPMAPVFREYSPQKAADSCQREMPFFSVRRKRKHSLAGNTEEPTVAKESVQNSKPIARAIRPCHGPSLPETCKQKPIWANTFQPSPTVVPADEEEEDFQEFCRANNFIPIVPVNPNTVIHIAPPESTAPFLTPYLMLPDLVSKTYTFPFDDIQPSLTTVRTYLTQPVEKAPSVSIAGLAPITQQSQQSTADQYFNFTLEETSEPIDDEGSREAKALDPVWGAQILENFVKKYPMTGQHKPSIAVSEQNENLKSADNGQYETQRSKVEEKATSVKARTKRATEIQQKLEMILLQQRESKAPLAPPHKIRATEIQQKLEVMLYKLKEQKALEGFSKRVLKTFENERRSEKSFGKNSEKEVCGSRSTSKPSKGTVRYIENLR